MAYKHPEFSIGDEVVVVTPSEDKLAKNQTPGFITALKPARDVTGVFSGWKYEISLLNEDKTVTAEAVDLQGRTVVLRQYTKRM